MTTDRSSRIYQDGTYLRRNPTWHEEDAGVKTDDIIKLMERHALKPGTVCEVGCGAGGILVQLSRRLGPEVQFSGYEISPQAFELCRTKEAGNLHFYLGDFLEEEAFFDLVLAVDVFEHVEDYLSFLRRLKGKGRYKIFRIPLDISVQSVLFKSRPLLRARQVYGHLHYFTRETAMATLGDLGYQVIDYLYTFTFPQASRGRLGWPRFLLKSLKKMCLSLHPEWLSRLLDGFSLTVLTE